jgi:hypothetical protein
MLTPSELVKVGCDVSWRTPIEPGILPEARTLAIADYDQSTCPEQLFVDLGTGYLSSPPWPIRISELEPEPSQT